MRNTLIEAHIADIHFGVIDPYTQLNILREQFLNKLYYMKQLDIVSINGDLFDRKFLANSDAVRCCNMFIIDLMNICRMHNATIILIHGTESHDAHQLNMYDCYRSETFRIIDHIQFIIVKGKTILCIPEENNKNSEYYMSQFRSMEYDACYLHGTYVGSIYGFNNPTLEGKKAVFELKHFWRCNGPIICGHVHVPQCLHKHVYYCGSPIRWMFGEEQPKGFLILCHNLETQEYYVGFEEIVSFRYDTLDLDNILMSDPREIINYLERLKSNGIDYIKLKIRKRPEIVPILRDHFRNSNWMTIEDIKPKQESETVENKYNGLDFLMDNSLDEYTKFVMYVNSQEGEGFITVDKLKEVLKEDLK